MNFVRSFTKMPLLARLCRHRQLNVIMRSNQNAANISRGGTIYALSSGYGKCGVAVLRISGPNAEMTLQEVCKKQSFKPREATLCKLFHPKTDEHLDTGIVIWFPAPFSFTGEPCCELQIHGGSAVIAALLDALSCVPGLIPAEAGQFTMRAFQNNKLDLTEVEGLADLIHAETESQRKQALEQMGGSLGNIYSGWRKRLVKCVANSVAFIDFSEEENIEDNVLETVRHDVNAILNEVRQHLSDNRRGERLRNGIHVAILGEPNVGKSSLLNLICQRPAAIVSPIAGTTRDVIETALDIGGYPVLLSDTAGLRETQDIIEMEGVERALKKASEADIKVVMMDATKLFDIVTVSYPKEETLQNITSQYLQELGLTGFTNVEETGKCTDNTAYGEPSALNSTSLSIFENSIIILNKVDKLNEEDWEEFEMVLSRLTKEHLVTVSIISCITEEGIDKFLENLKSKVETLCTNKSSTSPSLTQARYRYHLTHCLECLEEYLLLEQSDIVLATEALRNAMRHVGKITGQITSEEVLDVVFRDFCIGK